MRMSPTQSNSQERKTPSSLQIWILKTKFDRPENKRRKRRFHLVKQDCTGGAKKTGAMKIEN